MRQIHRKHLIYGQNCLKERLSGLLSVARSRVIPYMESSLSPIAVIFRTQLIQQSRSLDFPAQRLKLDGLPHLLSRAGGTDWFLDPAHIP